MNIRRGLFRLWIVASVLWTLAIGALFGRYIVAPSIEPQTYTYEWDDGLNRFADLFPELTGHFARASNGYAYIGLEDTHQRVNFPDDVVLMVRRMRAKQPINEAKLQDISRAFAAKYVGHRGDKIRAAQIGALTSMAEVIAIPPIIVLVLGSALVWAFSGFAKKRRDA